MRVNKLPRAANASAAHRHATSVFYTHLFAGVGPRDVVFLNVDAWYGWQPGFPQRLHQDLDGLFAWFAAHPRAPLLVWRESFPTHWPGGQSSGKTACRADHAYHLAQQYRVVNEWAAAALAARRSVLRSAVMPAFWPLSVRADEHTPQKWWLGNLTARPRLFDCLHWCGPSSSLRLVNRLIYNVLIKF